MAGDTDFIALYQELGLDSSCTLEAFKQAYRKRVGAIHPDRQPLQARSPEELQRLNTLYSAAIEFQRRHGRLPGTQQVPMSSRLAEPVANPASMPRGIPAAAEPRGNFRTIIAIVIVVFLGLWIAGQFAPADSSMPTLKSNDSKPRADAQPAKSPTAHAIKLGATAQQVRSIHGEPVSGWEQRWEYGPSWIAFRCGQVVDWYSSPLRPLKVASAYPSATTQWSPPKNCKE